MSANEEGRYLDRNNDPQITQKDKRNTLNSLFTQQKQQKHKVILILQHLVVMSMHRCVTAVFFTFICAVFTE